MTDSEHENDTDLSNGGGPDAPITDTPITDPHSGYVIYVNSATKSEVHQLLMDSHQITMNSEDSRKRLEAAVSEMDGAVELWAAGSNQHETDVGKTVVKSLDTYPDTVDTEANP